MRSGVVHDQSHFFIISVPKKCSKYKSSKIPKTDEMATLGVESKSYCLKSPQHQSSPNQSIQCTLVTLMFFLGIGIGISTWKSTPSPQAGQHHTTHSTTSANAKMFFFSLSLFSYFEEK